MQNNYTAEELAARRREVQVARDDSRLEGIPPDPAMDALADRYCAGELSTVEYQHAIFQLFWERCPNKDWRPVSDPSWSPEIR